VKKLYAAFGLLVVLGYGWADLRGHEFSAAGRRTIPQSARGAHGGYRSYWYSGFHGGK
jgi:hypothetical protein